MPPDNPSLVESTDNRLHPEELDIPGIAVPNPTEWAIGLFLCDLASFNNSVRNARQELAIQELVPYRVTRELSSILDMLSGIDHDNGSPLSITAKRIAERYKLSENWYLPLQLAILTHHLIIPADPAVIMRRPPDTSSLAGVMAYLQEEAPPMTSPIIYPVYRVTINQLHTFIDQHKDEIRRILDTLPPRPTTSTSSHTMLWGRLAWLMRQETPRPSWTETASWINDFTGRLRGFATASLNNVQAREMYERYLQQLRRLDND